MKIYFKYLLSLFLFFSSVNIALAQYVTFGQGNVLTTSNLFSTANEDSKSKLIFKNSELISNSNPLNIGDTIYSVGWEISSIGVYDQAMYGANIKITETGNSVVVWTGVLAQKIGWNDIILNDPYVKVSNGDLIVEFCFDNCSQRSSSLIFTSQVSSPSAFNYFSGNSANGCNYTPNITSNERPNTRFGIYKPNGTTSYSTTCIGINQVLTSVSNISPIISISGFSYQGTNNGSYYFLSDTNKIWTVADLYCRQMGGHLVHIDDVAENNYIYAIRMSLGSDLLIGLKQNCNSSFFAEPAGGWELSDATVPSYYNWNSTSPPINGSSDEPNNLGTENYSALISSGTPNQGVWDDIGFSTLRAYVLEIEDKYLWSTGATTPSISVNPSITTTFWVDHSLGNQTEREYFTVTVGDGCIDTSACNYDSLATCDDGSCLINFGCTDETACNYDSLATCDNGSCIYNTSTILVENSCYGNSTGEINVSVSPIISGFSYTYSIIGSITSQNLPYNIPTSNLATGYYDLEFFINSISCSIQQIFVPEFIETNTTITNIDESCDGLSDGIATISVDGYGAGSGTISLLTYCSSNPAPPLKVQLQTIIEEVQLTGDNFSILNNTAAVPDFYEDYTNNVGQNGEYADLTEGQNYTVNITPSNMASQAYHPEAINVYIDFNIDGDFDDLGEDLGVINIPIGSWNPGTVYPFSFNTPTTGIYGPTRMRVVCMSNGNFGAVIMGPCVAPSGYGIPYFGGTEDYSLVLNSPVSASYLWSNGGTSNVISNLAAGSYNVTITDANGCITTENTNINSGAIVATAFAGSPISICAGSTVMISDAVATNYSTVNWISSGLGTFTADTTLNPIYTPSIADVNLGNVVLTLTSNSINSCPDATDTIYITIEPIPSTGLILHN